MHDEETSWPQINFAWRLRADALGSSNTFALWLDGDAGRRYVIESTADFTDWEPVETNRAIGHYPVVPLLRGCLVNNSGWHFTDAVVEVEVRDE